MSSLERMDKKTKPAHFPLQSEQSTSDSGKCHYIGKQNRTSKIKKGLTTDAIWLTGPAVFNPHATTLCPGYFV